MKLQIARWMRRYHQSVAVHSEGLPPLPPSSTLRKSTNSGLPPKPHQRQSRVHSSNSGIKTATLNAPKPQSQKINESQIRTVQINDSRSGQNGGGGDVLLQWGQRKRSKRTMADKFSGGISMPPSRPPLAASPKLRPNRDGVLSSKDNSPRKLQDKMGSGGATNGSPSSKSNSGTRLIPRSTLGKRSHSSTTSEKTDSMKPPHPHQPPPKDKSTDSTSQSKGDGEAVVEWPRISVALSRKEKEDDFFAMKGTKLPHRPKKRSKAIDRALQYCFPGTFLSDLSMARYQVKERKTVKKPKHRGLKGLENMESDSD